MGTSRVAEPRLHPNRIQILVPQLVLAATAIAPTVLDGPRVSLKQRPIGKAEFTEVASQT